MKEGQIWFTKDHEWIKEAEGIYLVGITDFAAQELGELVFVDLPVGGKTFKKGDVLAVVESTKTASDVYAPLDLEVTEVNLQLKSNPNLINQSPFEHWIVKAKLLDPSGLSSLLSEEDYRRLING